MCANCFTSLDAIALNGAGAVALSAGAWRRVRDRLSGYSAGERRVEAWEATAAFLAEMGHDASAVLGPPPATRTSVDA